MESDSIVKEKPATPVEIEKAVEESSPLQNAFEPLQWRSRREGAYTRLEVREDTSGSGQLVHCAIAVRSARASVLERRGPGDTNTKKRSLQRRQDRRPVWLEESQEAAVSWKPE